MRHVSTVGIGFAALLLTASASGQDPAPPGAGAPAEPAGTKLPIAYAERPLTLPEMTLSPEFDMQIVHVDVGRGFTATAFMMELAASFGVMDDLTVEARPLGLVAGDVDTDYTRFQLGATYRFLKDPVEIGARFRLQLDNAATFALNPGLPIRIHAADIVRIDTGVNFTLSLPTNGADVNAALAGIYTDYLRPAEVGIPLDVAFQIVPPAFVGLSTGFGIADFGNAGDSIIVPLGLFAGGTIPGDQGPLADIGASFGFPFFILSGADDNPLTELWSIGITARGFLYL